MIFAVHNSVMGTPDFDYVRVPVVPDVHTSAALCSLDEITPILADDLLDMGFPLLGHLEMPVIGLAQRRIVDLGVAVIHGEK